jgi:hypothetical protein
MDSTVLRINEEVHKTHKKPTVSQGTQDSFCEFSMKEKSRLQQTTIPTLRPRCRHRPCNAPDCVFFMEAKPNDCSPPSARLLPTLQQSHNKRLSQEVHRILVAFLGCHRYENLVVKAYFQSTIREILIFVESGTKATEISPHCCVRAVIESFQNPLASSFPSSVGVVNHGVLSHLSIRNSTIDDNEKPHYSS